MLLDLPRRLMRRQAVKASPEPGDASLAESLLAPTALDGEAVRDLAFHEVTSLEHYQAYVRRAEAAYRARRHVELLLAAPQRPFRYPGYDALAGRPVWFSVDYTAAAASEGGLSIPNYRERLVSPTGLNARVRGSLLALRHLLGSPDLAGRRVYLTERITPLFAQVQAIHPGVIGSEYLGPDVPPGAERDGIRHEDLTRLSFPDASLDVVLCNDVLEHVPGYEAALRELARVLAPGGVLLVTVPFAVGQYGHDLRARLGADGSVEHLQPPVYHGDPLDPEQGILCYQIFGWSLLDELRAAGFRASAGLLFWSLYHGLIGDQDLVVWYARR